MEDSTAKKLDQSSEARKRPTLFGKRGGGRTAADTEQRRRRTAVGGDIQTAFPGLEVAAQRLLR